MKTYIDRLRECPLDMLKNKNKRQETEAEIVKRDLETMKGVLAERENQSQQKAGVDQLPAPGLADEAVEVCLLLAEWDKSQDDVEILSKACSYARAVLKKVPQNSP